MESWVKLYRKSIEGGWLKNSKLWTFWTYCLLKASHKKHKVIVGFQEVELEPGQFIFGRKKASKELRISEQSVRTCVDFLKTAENITIKTTNRFSVITIVNWSVYQEGSIKINQQINQQPTNNQPTTNQQLTTNKKGKKGKNDKKKEKIYTPQVNFLIDEYFKTLTEKQQVRFEKQRDKFHDCCDKLMRIDGFSEEEIRKAVRFARYDTFWSQNFLSFLKLRQKDKAGVMYIEVFSNKVDKQRPNNSFDDSLPSENRRAEWLKMIDEHIGDKLSVFKETDLPKIKKKLDNPTYERILSILKERGEK